MSSEDAAAPASVAAAATSYANIRLSAFSENSIEAWLDSHDSIWFCNHITKSVVKYQLVRAALPANIMDAYGTEVARMVTDQDPYASLRDFLIKRFAKNKWCEYFRLLSLPIAFENVRPMDVLSRLKSYLPYNAGVDNEIFMAMFLMRLPDSIREAVGSANHATVSDMCTHAENMYNFRGGYGPMATAAAAVQQRSRSPAKTGGKQSEKGKPQQKKRSASTSFGNFKNPKNGSCKYHNYYGAWATHCVAPCNVTEN
jgi:hypothetical protein